MAKNKAKVNKFLTGAITATLVASAVVPVASAAAFTDLDNVGSNVKAEVDKAVELGFFKDADKFNPAGTINRSQAALTLARYIAGGTADTAALKAYVEGKNLESKVTPFDDVPASYKDGADYQEELYYASLIVKDAEAFTQRNLNPSGDVTRSQMAKIITGAFGLEKAADFESKITDINHLDAETKDFIETIASHGVTNVTTFNPAGTVTRSQMASFLVRSYDVVNAEALVGSVSAINGTTLTVTGNGLQNLKAEDITLANNEVASVVASADGKTATVTFKSSFVLDQEYTVSVAQGEETKEYKFTYSLEEVKSVELDQKTYDDDTAGQMLTFKINGAAVTSDTEWLRQAGYTVNFVAVDNSTNVAATNFFVGSPSSTSSTGLLANEVLVGEYTVEIQVVKDGTVVVSDKKVITVADLESTTTAITDVELTNVGTFVHNSSTLVTGETATITDIVGNAAGKKDVSLPVEIAEVTSSDVSVISINGAVLTANVAGNATITVKIGDVTKTVNLTVSNKARAITKVTPSEGTVKVVEGATRTIQVTSLDQYGDPIAVAAGTPPTAGTVEEDIPEDAANAPLIAINDVAATDTELITNTATGQTTDGFSIEGLTKGNGTLIFKDAAGKNIGQIAIQVTDVDNVASTKVEYTVASDKTTNSINVANVNEYQVSKFNKAGFYNGAETLNVDPAGVTGELTVESADATVAAVALVGTDAFSVTPQKPGKTDILVKDENGLVVHKFNVTITATPTVITKVNFKSNATIDYAGKLVDVTDVLDVRPDAALDPIVYGVEHNANTIAKVRLDNGTVGTGATGDVDEAILYIDNNGNGEFDAEDVSLGAVTAEVLTGSTTVTGTLADGSIDIAPGSYTTASTDKGTILFRVLVESNGVVGYQASEAVATTVLNVNVK